MHYTRSFRQTNIFKRLWIAFFVFMLIFSGFPPVSPSGLSPVTHAADNACPAPVALINGGFEQPKARNVGDTGSPGAEHAWQYFYEDEVPGWETAATDDFIQIMQNSNNFLGPSLGGNAETISVVAADGTQFAELNANQAAMLYQDVETVPGETIYWRLAHRGEFGTDTMQLRIGNANTPSENLPVVQQMSSTFNKWTYYTGSYTVPEGQTATRFGFEAVSTSTGNAMWGNLLDDIFLGTAPCVTSTKTVDPPGEVGVGTELTYTINVKNEGGDIAADTAITDLIPAGTEYVPGSMVMTTASSSQNLTDEADADVGQFDGSQVVIQVGDLVNTTQLPDGVTVQFKVKVLSDYAVRSINNKAQISYDNLLSGGHEIEESNGVTVDVNHPPISPDFEETTWENTPVTGSVYGVDVNGDPLAFTTGSDPQNGTVTVNPDGTWTYVPNPDFTGTDSFTVIVSDGKGGTSTSTVQVEVIEPPNQAPVTENDNVTTQQDTSVTGSVYGHDPDGDPLTYTIESNPKNGTVTLEPDGTWTYVPNNGYAGPDIFTVIVSDGRGGFTTSTVTVDVTNKPNNPPAASNENVTTENGKPVSGAVNGTDPDGDPLNYTKGTNPGNGTVTVNPDGTWTYIPDPDFVGEDSFTIIVEDGKGGQTESTVTVDVTSPANQSPTAPDGSVTTEKDTSVSGAVYGTDPDRDPLTYTKGQDPEHGDVTVNPDGTWTYTPDPGFVGDDSFTVIVDDGRGGQTEVTITVGVTDNGGSGGSGGGGGGGSNDDDDDDSRSPQLESEKTAVDVNGGSIEVGDTIEYTIRARNTVSSSQVTNMVISDELPEELEYVPGSLKVDGATVTDNDDSDRGEYVDGTVTGSFGTVTDTDWHTVVFEAKISKGEKGDKIENVGEVSGDNLDESDTPSEEIIIGNGIGSNPGIPGEPNDGTSTGNPTNPGWGGSDSDSDSGSGSGTPDAGQSGGSDGAGGFGQSGTSGDSVNGGSGEGEGTGTGNKLPNTATNMYSCLVAGFIILLAGLFLLRRKKA